MRRFPTYTKIGFLMAGLLALGFLLPPISQADPNFTPEKVLKKVKPKSGKQRSPDSNLREVVGTLKYGDEDWKAVVEYIGQKDTVLQVEIDGGVAMKFREKTAFYERGTMATISHPIYKNPIIITVWEKGVGSKIVRIFYPSESLEPMQTLESPDENISF